MGASVVPPIFKSCIRRQLVAQGVPAARYLLR